ncbi:MAG: iron-sulfur cluster assembly scaffold protein [Candidatus Burarchaeum sp.]|nr:iron-sulfur cluster assembly scaffold protein [Candidatus Burarchaeum sp.]MDO8339555.1 iron-sulfur cluster assembly scaffold protein [Candidatus Burarchaeum sp.]
MALKYTKKVLEYFLHPKNMGEIEGADAEATEGSPACGDMVSVYLKVNPKTHVIEDIKFKSYGCASNIATASIITEMAKGKKLEEAKKIEWNAAADELGGLPSVKMHCSVLAAKTLMAAIRDYEQKHGLAKAGAEGETELTSENVMNELMGVINPDIGINIVRLKMVKNVEVDGKAGAVKVEISLGNTDEMFTENIKEEVEEHVKALKGVKKVEVSVSK